MANKVEIVKIEARRLNSSLVTRLRQQMTSAWSTSATAVVLDFSEVVYIDSLGISALISEQRRRPSGARIVFCSVGDYVRDVLEVTQLYRVFDIYASAEAASSALAE